MSTVVCTACSHELQETDRGQHYRGEWHRYNVKRRVAGLEPLTLGVYENKLSALRVESEASARTFECKLCKKTFSSEAAFNQHMKSKKHLKRAANAKAHPKPAPVTRPPEPESLVPAEDQVMAEAAEADVGADALDGDDHDAKVEDVPVDAEEDETLDEDGEGAVPVGTCLFSLRPFDTTDALLDHMLKKFGFYLPYVSRLRDLEGLLGFLGEKVGVGHVCIHCHQRFRSSEAVRKHMIAKSHCKLRFETEEDLEEMEFFYDLEEEGSDVSDEEMEEAAAAAAAAEQPLEQTAGGGQVLLAADAAPRRVSYLTEQDELVMNDGSMLGHRSRAHKYNRGAPLLPREATGLAAKLSQQYKLIGLPGYTNQREKGPVPRDITRRRNKYLIRLAKSTNSVSRKHFKDSTGVY